MPNKKKSFFTHILQDIMNASWHERWRAFTLWVSITVLSILCSLVIVFTFPFAYFLDKKRHFASWCIFLWSRAILKCCPWWTDHIVGLKNLEPIKNKSVIYVANHQSHADVIAVCLLGQSMRWIVKDSLAKIPFFGWGLVAAGAIFVKRTCREDTLKAFQQCEKLLQKGNSIFFFPEGTRSPTGKMRSFKSGAFRLAKSQNIPIVPITLSGCAQLLPKGSIIPRPTKVVLTVHPVIYPADITLEELIDTTYQNISSALETQDKIL